MDPRAGYYGWDFDYPDLIERLTSFHFGPYRISNFEMETSAIYGLGSMLGHQCLSLNVIVANRISKTFSAQWIVSCRAPD